MGSASGSRRQVPCRSWKQLPIEPVAVPLVVLLLWLGAVMLQYGVRLSEATAAVAEVELQQAGVAEPARRRILNSELVALKMATREEEEAFKGRGDGGGGGRAAQALRLSCRGDAAICRDPVRNPGGGATCCWNRVCKDTETDVNHCGGCGHRCGFGLHCCGGACVNLLWDNFNCGCCGHRCLPPSQCSFETSVRATGRINVVYNFAEKDSTHASLPKST